MLISEKDCLIGKANNTSVELGDGQITVHLPYGQTRGRQDCLYDRKTFRNTVFASSGIIVVALLYLSSGLDRSIDKRNHMKILSKDIDQDSSSPHKSTYHETKKVGFHIDLPRTPHAEKEEMIEEKKDEKNKKKNKVKDKGNDDNDHDMKGKEDVETQREEKVVESVERCKWVVDTFTKKNAEKPMEELREQYLIQSADANVFYRATAEIFWRDFRMNGWGKRIDFETIGIAAVQSDGTPLQPRSTWTWVTGDQHLSNFGAWRNRNRETVFSVNDFDEAGIFDFGVDVLRIATSICSHAHTNGLSENETRAALRAFTDTYVETLVKYVGGDRELLYELTPSTATGSLQRFLASVEKTKSSEKQLTKFTDIDKKTGKRIFIKNESTRLIEVTPEIDNKIRNQFTIDKYGATMMKVGWHTYSWSEFFDVLDIAARVGSGIGSYGVDRYYVLLNGIDGSLGTEGADGSAVILDVKMEPNGAMWQVLSEEEKAWYNVMFSNEAARAILAQRKLTSYVDPFTGWVMIGGNTFVVRQRSPWKDSPNLNKLKDPDDFIEFMEQVAIVTATSHARGTAAKSPGQFKHVIASVLGRWRQRTLWGEAVADVASDYRQQVLFDFQCFKDFVNENFSL